MGGHGALTLYLNSVLSGRKQYRSASAFAPISNPTKCPWGEKAFKNYLQGGIDEAKDKYDATELIRKTNKEPLHILIDYVGVDSRRAIVGRDAYQASLTGHGRQLLPARPALARELPQGGARRWLRRSAGPGSQPGGLRPQLLFRTSPQVPWPVILRPCLPLALADIDLRRGPHSL